MTNSDKYFERLSAMVSAPSFVPTVLLFALLALALVVMLRAQGRKDFDFAEMLKDENNKVSSTRMFSFISLAVTSWVVSFLTIADKLTPEYFWYYLIIWSGTAVALKVIEKWNGSLPFTRGDMQQAVQSGAQAAALGAAAASPPTNINVTPEHKG